MFSLSQKWPLNTRLTVFITCVLYMYITTCTWKSWTCLFFVVYLHWISVTSLSLLFKDLMYFHLVIQLYILVVYSVSLQYTCSWMMFNKLNSFVFHWHLRDHHGCDRMAVGFTTMYVIIAFSYQHWCCEFESWTLCDKVCQCLTAGQWISLNTLVSSTNKTNRHDTTEVLLKVALNTITLNPLTLNLYIQSIVK